jgi:ribosomal-protein-alanine N-acetyltransferase
MNDAHLMGKLCRIRPYRVGDEDAICAVANDFIVARWMSRSFPYPYVRSDAEQWIKLATSDTRRRYFAIEVDGVLAGGIGVEPFGGERSGTAAFGYWLGRHYWGRGIGTDAAKTLSDRALRTGRLRRLEARVFAPNVASARVLEKCGFVFEGRLRDFYIDRNGSICDALNFARFTTNAIT